MLDLIFANLANSRKLIPCENEFPRISIPAKINSNSVNYCPLRRGMSFYLLQRNKRNYTINKSQSSMKVINKYIEVWLEFAKPWCVFCRLFVCFCHLKNAKICRTYKGGESSISLGKKIIWTSYGKKTTPLLRIVSNRSIKDKLQGNGEQNVLYLSLLDE